MQLFITIVERVNRALGYFAAWAVFVIVALQFVIVVTRYVFGFNVIWLQDLVTYGHAMVFMLGAAVTLACDKHVRIDIFYTRMSPLWQARIDFYSTLFLLYPFCLFMLWFSFPYVIDSWSNLEGSFQTMGLQYVYILKSLLLIFPLSLLLQGGLIALRAYSALSADGAHRADDLPVR